MNEASAIQADSRGLFDLSSKTALITGASRGIGRAIALAFAAAGADIVVHYASRREDADETVAQVKRIGRRVFSVSADLSAPGAGSRLARTVLESVERVDILVLNAASQLRQAPLDVDDDAFMDQVNSGFRSGWEMARVLVPLMAHRGWGRLLTIGSVQQTRPNFELSVYGAMKCAQAHLARNFGRVYAGRGVTANNIAPGLIDTERCDDLKRNPQQWQSLLDKIPAGRAGLPEDIAGIALTLASPAGSYITAADIPVDGGLAIP